MKIPDHDWGKDKDLEVLAAQVSDLDYAISVCALRFLGNDFVDRKCPESGFPALIEPVVSNLLFHDDDLDNLAVFFGLQRYLGKWGGEGCTPWSREHTAYRLLFLHCYRMEIPSSWALEEYNRRWKSDFEPRREQIAAAVRKTLKTPGNGPLNWHYVSSNQ